MSNQAPRNGSVPPIADTAHFADVASVRVLVSVTMNHPIITQARNDIKAAKKLWLPSRVLAPWGVFCFAVIAIFDRFGIINLALPLLSSIAIFAFFIYLKWGLRRQPLFWGTVAVLAAIHAVMLWYVPWTSTWVPSLAIAGIASIDLCLMFWVLAAVEVLLRGATIAEN